MSILGVHAVDPYWQMTIALLERHYRKQKTTVSALAGSAGVPYTTALRHIKRMIGEGLLQRSRSVQDNKLVFVEPTGKLLHNFASYCAVVKTQVGATLGMSAEGAGDFTFGGAYLAAKIIPRPTRLDRPLGIDPPLRLLLKDDPTFLSLARLRSEVSHCLGIAVDEQVMGYDALYRQIIENSRKPESDWDIVALDMPWLGQLTQADAILPLDLELKRSSFNVFDFYAAAWEGGQCRGAQMSIPFAPTPELFLYRTDKFARHGLAPPRTTDEVLAAAADLHDPDRGRYAISWNAARGQPLGQSFIQIMAAFGAPPVTLRRFGEGYDLDTPWETLEPSLDTEVGHQTLDYIRALQHFSPPDIRSMDWYGRVNAYRTGRTAMTYEWSSRTVQFEDDVHSPARGKTGYLPHPAGPQGRNISPMGGFLLAIPANLAPDRVAAAWRTICWLSTPEMVKHLILNGSPVSLRYSVSADPEVGKADPVVRHVDAMAKLGQLQLWPRPAIPQMAEMMRIVGETLHDALWGEAPISKVLKRTELALRPIFDSVCRRSQKR